MDALYARSNVAWKDSGYEKVKLGLTVDRVPCVSPLSVDIREPFIVYEAGCGVWMLMLLGRR